MAGDRVEVPYHRLDVSGDHITTDALKRIHLNTEEFASSQVVPVVEDPNLDPFYLERALEVPKNWSSCLEEDSEVDLDELENEYFRSYMTKNTKLTSTHQIRHADPHTFKIQHSRVSLGLVEPTTPNWQNTYHHHHTSSCSSVQTDATEETPDLTPSSSFSSTYSDTDYQRTTQSSINPAFLQTHRTLRNRTTSKTRFYLPAATPETQSRACTRSNTPVERFAIAALAEYHNFSTETLTMVPKEPIASAASSLCSKPLPSLPPIRKASEQAPSARKTHNNGSRGHIDPSLISPPSLVNPVTKEPHMSPFNHAMFIPAHDCPSPVPNPGTTNSVTRRSINASIKGRPSTSTCGAYGEQSVWESDSESGSISGKSQLRRGPIDTLRKVRSRVQLRRIAKSDAKLQADISNSFVNSNNVLGNANNVSTPSKNAISGLSTVTSRTVAGTLWTSSGLSRAGQPDRYPHDVHDLAQLQTRTSSVSVSSLASDVLPPPPPLKQTLRLVAPSTTSLSRPQSARDSNEKLSGDIDSSTAAAIQAQSRRRQRSNATDEYLPFPKVDRLYRRDYCTEHSLPSSATASSNTLQAQPQLTVLQRLWYNLRSLDCRNG